MGHEYRALIVLGWCVSGRDFGMAAIVFAGQAGGVTLLEGLPV